MDKEYLFSKMPVKEAVLRQVVPTVISQMVVLAYNLTDTYYVGLLNDPRQTAAVTVAFPSTLLMTAAANLFAVGGAGRIAYELGKGHRDAAEETAAVSFWGALLSALLLSFLYWLSAGPVLRISGADAATFPAARAYVKWVVIAGGIGFIMNIVLANLIRSEGGAFIASIGVSGGGILNMILDPFFVLDRFLGMGAEGAGLATAISGFASTFFFLAFILFRGKDSVLKFGPRRLAGASLRLPPVLKTGFPSSVQYLLTMVAVGAMTKFISAYGSEAVAALGIVKKIDQLPMTFAIGVSSGVLPLISFNYSSGDYRRRRAIFSFALFLSFSFAMLCLVVFELMSPVLVRLFIEDEKTVRYGAAFLRIMVVGMPLMALNYPLIVNFQGMGRIREALICSVLRKGLLDIPVLLLLDRLVPMYGLTAVQPVIDTISLIVAGLFYRKILKEEAM